MPQNFEMMYEELLQFLYRTPWGLIQATRNGDIQMMNPVAAKVLMPVAIGGRLENLFALLRNGRPELKALVEANTERYCVVCEDLPLPGLQQQVLGSGDGNKSLSISIFIQNHDTLMVVLRESQILERNGNASQHAELRALQNLPHLGLLKTREGLIIWSNPTTLRMLHHSDKQLHNAPFANLFAPGVGDLLMESCLPALMAGASYTERLTLLPRSADSVTLELSATILCFEKQEILWTLMVPTEEEDEDEGTGSAKAQAIGPTEGMETL
jgi:nitrogen-specific signal transduction histidine kinase